MTLTLMVALTQCKKEQVSLVSEDKTVDITLDIKDNGGMRVDVNTITGAVNYQSGDVVYVASGGKYVGTLTYNGTRFSGAITDPIVGEPLHFYFLGNVTPYETLTEGTTQSCSVVISDQTERLPVIEYAPSYENYTSGATAFSAFLLNKCALVKFNVTTSSEAATSITGMKNKVIVDFSANTLTHCQEGNGVITLPAGNGEKWGILLPQGAMEAGEEGSAYSVDGIYIGTCGAVPTIRDNDFLTVGIPVTVGTGGGSALPDGCISGVFTIDYNGTQVHFSQGNLQYIGSATTPYWKFADNQWDYFGETTGQNSDSQTVDRDLFGWGTSGYSHGATCYQPWSTSTDGHQYYAYNSYLNNLYDDTGQADWGYNAISNGGNTVNSGWRTLTKDEWGYVYNYRSTSSGIRWAKGTVNGVCGLILLPDNWSSDIYTLNSTNNGIYNSNLITADDWTNILEANGAVFFPASGYRTGTYLNNAGSSGYYWSATQGGTYTTSAYYTSFSGSTGNSSTISYKSNTYRYYGYSVRLVRNVE